MKEENIEESDKMAIRFKFKRNAIVAHFLYPKLPMQIVERLYYDREGGGTKQYFCRIGGYGGLCEKLTGFNESELKFYEGDKK